MYDVTGVIWPYRSFSSIPPDQIELERREGHQVVRNELPNLMICNTTTLSQGTDLASRDLTLTWGQHEPWPFINKKVYYSTRLGKMNTMVPECLICEHCCRSYSLKIEPLHLGHWPDLWRHRLTWDLKFRYQSLRLVTPDTLVFFPRSSNSIRGQTQKR